MNEWSNVITLSGTNKEGNVESVVLAQCPKCVALVWDVNKRAHDAWHETTAPTE